MTRVPSPRRRLRVAASCTLLPLLFAGCGRERTGAGADGPGHTPDAAPADSTAAQAPAGESAPASSGRLRPALRGEDPDPTAEDTLRVLYIGDEWILSPIWDMPSKLLVFSPMVERDRDFEIRGLLARSWEHSEDYREWTFHLRTDVRWHDGEPFTARDVAFTYRLLQHPDVARISPDAVQVEALNDSTVRFVYPPDPPGWMRPLDTYQGIYPQHLLGEKDPANFGEWEFWTRPVGTGPFRYVRHVPKTMVEVEANGDYFRGEPAVDRLILKFSGEAAPGLMELRAGNVDVLGRPGRMAALKARGYARFRTYHILNPQWTRLIFWNMSNPRFEEASVRRALTHAIDRRELLRVLNLPPDLPLVDGVPTRRQYVTRGLPEPLGHDPSRARRLLTAAGWRDTDGDGVRERDGRDFRFELLTQPEQRQAAVYVQSQLAAVGVRAEVLELEPRVLSDRARSREFAALLDRIDPARLSRLIGEGSLGGFRHERAAHLRTGIEGSLSPRRRDSLHRELMPIFRSEQPATFLFPEVMQVVAHRRVRGLSSLPPGVAPLMEAEHLWIEEPREVEGE